MHTSLYIFVYTEMVTFWRGEPMQIAIDKPLENYRRLKFLEACDAACAALQQDPDAWKDYQDELKSLEGTLIDLLRKC